jgi:hypothetical protein
VKWDYRMLRERGLLTLIEVYDGGRSGWAPADASAYYANASEAQDDFGGMLVAAGRRPVTVKQLKRIYARSHKAKNRRKR